MRLLLTPLAEQDLEEIGNYVTQDNPTRAHSFVQELQAQCQKICLNPAGYRRRPELSSEVRSCAHGNYVIFFEASEEARHHRSRPARRARHPRRICAGVARVSDSADLCAIRRRKCSA